MALTVNTNLSALQAYNSLSRTSASMASSMAKLSSGLRINTAADDAAGLTISEGLKAQVNGYGIAARNAQDGINMIQTADGAMGEVHSILQRMRDLAVQGANDSNNADSRTAIAKEAGDLSRELYRIAEGTNFNGIDLLKGGSKAFQVGAGGTANDTISVTLATAATDTGTLASADGTAAGAGFDVSTNAAAQTTITAIDTAIKAVSTSRAGLGAVQNRLNHALNIANVSSQNLAASQSHITDTDMAQEMVNYTKTNILSQAGTAMLAQANQSGQRILKLLG
ncbi:flagellin [Intrasporangium flavum]|uniref:flagellin N-terminal helical domain-containing protein n=1 Tax=Intrasporangium flavum TaxID=1428657 RepID=UPI00096F198D|nr:flagellin [Intrasporangium flavum]